MIILVVARHYAEFRNFIKFNFPHYPLTPTLDRDFQFIDPESADRANSIQRGSMYIHLSGEMPDWFINRFTRIEIK